MIKQEIIKYTLAVLMAFFVALPFVAFHTQTVNAQGTQKQLCIGANGPDAWDEASGTCSSGEDASLSEIVKRVVNILLFIVGAAAVIMLIIGGIRYVVSGGDQNAVQGAKNTILYAIVGIVVAFLAFAIVNFVITELGDSTTADEASLNTPLDEQLSLV